MTIRNINAQKIFKLIIAFIIVANAMAFYMFGKFLYENVYGTMNLNENYIQSMARENEKSINMSAYNKIMESIKKRTDYSPPEITRIPFEDSIDVKKIE
jgi:hypothetical protein